MKMVAGEKAFSGFLWAVASCLCFTISWGLRQVREGLIETPAANLLLLVRVLLIVAGYILMTVAAVKVWRAVK